MLSLLKTHGSMCVLGCCHKDPQCDLVDSIRDAEYKTYLHCTSKVSTWTTLKNIKPISSQQLTMGSVNEAALR